MPAEKHLNFDILFHSTRDGYAALLPRPLASAASVQFVLPFSEAELAPLSSASAPAFRFFKLVNEPALTHPGNATNSNSSSVDSPLAVNPQRFGEQLYRAIFTGPMLVEMMRGLDLARQQSKGLRIRLSFTEDAAELARLPWEYLYSPDWGRPVTLSEETPLVRYLDVAQPTRAIEVDPPLRILAVVSDPQNITTLQVEREWQLLQEAINGLDSVHQISLERLPTTTYETLLTRLQGEDVHVLHFIGHGYFEPKASTGGLIFEDARRNAQRIDAAQVGALLHDHTPLRLVFLNSCEGAQASANGLYTGLAQRLIQQEIPSVIAMQFPISDEAALLLARTFYTALAEGATIDKALTLARKALFGTRSDTEWATPVFFSRAEENQLVRTKSPFVRKEFEPEMVLVRQGNFWMGSDKEAGIPGYETPRHSVELKEYYISKYPITNAEFAAFVEASGHLAPAELGWFGNKPRPERQRHPVAGVTWHEALAYCEWLSGQTKRKYSLPNEAQWEKAARGIHGLTYPWGNEWDATRCNVDANQITAVDVYPQGVSPYSCYDMVGNLREWTVSLWGERGSKPNPAYAYEWKDDERNRLSANRQIQRVVRGGNRMIMTPLRAALRTSEYPEQRGLPGARLGFRVVMTPE